MSIRTLIPALLVLLMLPAVSFAEDDGVVERLDIGTTQAVFEDATRAEPIELSSAEDAAAYFEGEQLAALNEQVDWETHSVLIFAWRGSGQDRMDVEMIGDTSDEVRFVYRPGRTRDLRPHVYVFALEQGVVWEVGGGPGGRKGVTPACGWRGRGVHCGDDD